jgi:branched-chain amino acid aminotransferase
MASFHSINGQLVAAQEATLHVSDLALLRGYGIFDYFLVKKGRPLFIEDYLDRFFNSAALTEMEMPVSREVLHRQIEAVIAANEMKTGAIRLLLTGGYAEDSFTPAAPNWLVLAHDFAPPPEEVLNAGVKLLPQRFQRENPRAKTTNYGNALRMRKQVRDAGAYEALYHDGAHVLESFRSNIFFVFDGPALATPLDGILHGITRKHVIALAPSMNIPVEARPVSLGEIRHAREAFLTGSNRAILPVVQIGDQVIGDGKVGEWTKRLMGAWEGYAI